MNSKTVSMTNGSILKAIVMFAIPILIGNLFQEFYNLADTAVVGNFVGDDAIAAVGAATPVYNLVISLANGMANGFSVVVARTFGAGDMRNMRKAITLSYMLTLIISAVLTIVSLAGIMPLLRFLNTPDDIIDDTAGYLRIILMFVVVTMFYNMFAGIFRAVGNSRIPLYFLMISSAVNILLDILFVRGFGWGIAGTATATVIAQMVSVLLCIICIRRKFRELEFGRQFVVYDKKMLGDIFLTGISMGLMLAVVNVGSIALQYAVNSLGNTVITAHTAARRFDNIFMHTLGTISMAASTFASQNYGAGKYERVKKGILTAIGLSIGWSVFSTLCAFAFASPAVRLLTGTKNERVVYYAVKYIKINLPFFVILSVLLVLRSSLQGVGRKLVPLLGSLIELIAKFAAAIYIAPLGYTGICFLEPVIWFLCAIAVLIDFMRFIKDYTNMQKNKQEELL